MAKVDFPAFALRSKEGRYDNSMISTYCQCQLKHHLRYNHHRASLYDRVATDIGSATHECFAQYLLGDPLAETVMKWIDTFSKSGDEFAVAKFTSAVTALLEEYPLVHDPNGTTLIMSPERRNEAGEIVRPYGPKWIVRYPEISFQLPLTFNKNYWDSLADGQYENDPINRPISYMGRIDAVVEDGNQQLFALELKTSSRANEQWWKNKWRLDTQPIGYVAALTKHLSKIINGAVIIPVWIGKKASKMTPEIQLTYTPHKLRLWEEETIAKIQEMAASQHLPTGRSGGACSNPYLGTCDYFNYCHSDYNEEVLMQETYHSEWSPLATPEGGK